VAKQATQKQLMQRLIRRFRDETGRDAVDMHEVAEYAVKLGWELPQPKKPIDLLAAKFSAAAREETRTDKETGQSYRANLAVVEHGKGETTTLWADIDVAPRPFARKAFVQRREQMIGDAVQLTLDIGHWNRKNSDEEPINMPMDFTDDVEERLYPQDDDKNVAA